MKKMQCEVCGSTEIKKIADDLFECQSCGVQYGANEIQKLLVEITGEVKIDHTEDAEKMLARARQFEEKGDIQKAKEYYEKALDYDPENSEAHDKIAEIELAENVEPKVENNNFIIEKDIESKKATENFLKFLMQQKDISPDIYKEIEIMSVGEKYYPFLQIQGSYSGRYTGTAVYTHEEPYTDWRTESKFVNGKEIKKKVPVTKYRTVEDPRPVNGFCAANCTGIFSVSKEFNEFFTTVSPKEFDKQAKDSKKHINECMLRDFELFLTDKRSSVNESMNPFEIDSSVEEKDNLSYYKGFLVETKKSDEEWVQRASACQLNKVGGLCIKNAETKIPGDFSRDVHVNYGANSEDYKIIFFPVQIIEYAYKGEFYKAIVSLVQKYNVISATYPYSIEQKEIEKDSSEKISTASDQKGTLILGLILLIGAAVTFFLFENATPCIWTAIIGVVLMIENYIRRNNKIAKLKSAAENAATTLENARVQELKREYDAFFENYTDIDHINEAKEAVKKISKYSSDITKISRKYSEWGDDDEDDFDDDDDFDDEDEDDYE